MDEPTVRYLRGEATEFERRQIERRQGSEEQRAEFQSLRRMWEILGELDEATVGAPPRVDTIVGEVERRAGSRGRGDRRFISRGRSWMAPVAAAVAALTLFFSLANEDRGSQLKSPSLSSTGSYSSSGEVTTMSLSDGSVVRLGRGSLIEFLPSPDHREVALEGRAFFAVARAEYPFVVRTSVGVVRVTGTRFDVLAQGGELRVVVVEGTVTVRRDDQEAVLSAGQVGYLSDSGPPRVVALEDVFSFLDWPGGLLVFHDTPLAEVARELGRQFQREVRVGDPALEASRITAWFSDEPADEVVSTLCLITGARCTVSDSLITFKR